MLVSIILPLFTYRMGDRHPCRAVRGMVKWRHNRIQKGRGIEDGFYKKDAAGLTLKISGKSEQKAFIMWIRQR